MDSRDIDTVRLKLKEIVKWAEDPILLDPEKILDAYKVINSLFNKEVIEDASEGGSHI